MNSFHSTVFLHDLWTQNTLYLTANSFIFISMFNKEIFKSYCLKSTGFIRKQPAYVHTFIGCLIWLYHYKRLRQVNNQYNYGHKTMEFCKLVVASQGQVNFKFSGDMLILKVSMYLILIEYSHQNFYNLQATEAVDF